MTPWKKCLSEADKDKDGELNLAEFNQMMIGLI
jgi:Ca2+-binding EF-hand superfamily protein